MFTRGPTRRLGELVTHFAGLRLPQAFSETRLTPAGLAELPPPSRGDLGLLGPQGVGLKKYCFPRSMFEKGRVRLRSDSGGVGSNFARVSQEWLIHVLCLAPTLTHMVVSHEKQTFFE